MKLKTRSEGAEDISQAKDAPASPTNKQKPVYVYLSILFVAAAALIIVSFAMHTRSNEAVLGELHSSVNALENLQKSQEQNIALQKELEELQEELKANEETIAAYETQQAADASTIQALGWLAVIQQQYSEGEYDTCRDSITKFEVSGCADALPTENTLTETAPSPAQQFSDIKAALNIADSE